MDVTATAIVHGVSFGRSVIGLVTKPYETYRRIVERGSMGELFFVGALLVGYFVLASVVKVAAFRPFLLTKQFVVLSFGAASGALLAAAVVTLAGRLLGAAVSFRAILLAWSYTLLPTACWFLATSVLYVVLPPPRTTSIAGITFSLLFLVFSVALLWWKVTLAYLTLRFGLRFDLGKSLLVAGIAAPVMAAWSVFMYRMGIFRVPFL